MGFRGYGRRQLDRLTDRFLAGRGNRGPSQPTSGAPNAKNQTNNEADGATNATAVPSRNTTPGNTADSLTSR
jgi:hypothetical protein